MLDVAPVNGQDLTLGRDTSRDVHIARYQRQYLPTLAELVDRLSIVQLKEIFLPDHRDSYRKERAMIQHDIDLILSEKHAATGYRLTAKALHAIQVIQLTNRYIWENESKARLGGSEQDKLLKLTHSINGIRNLAKNELARDVGDRLDFKIDCFAESLVADYGNWNIFS